MRTATGQQIAEAMRGRADQALFIDEQSWQAGQWFGINPSSYDLWRGSTVEETPEEAMLRWNHSIDLPQPRTPGTRYRLACEVAVLKDKWEVAGVFPWKQSATHVTYFGWLDGIRNMFRESRERMMRVVAMDHARREITFTADAVYERALPPRSRVPAGLQKTRLDGRRKR